MNKILENNVEKNKIKKIGFILCLLFTICYFVHLGVQNISSILIVLTFIVAMFYKKNRIEFLQKIDKKISIGLLIFVLAPYVVYLIDGGKRIDMDDYVKFLFFFPLVYFLDNNKKINKFLKFLVVGSFISMVGGLITYIREYKIIPNPEEWDRVHFAMDILDYTTVMSISFLSLLSFLLFYKEKEKNKNIKIKLGLFLLISFNFFILLLTKSKIIIVSLIPVVIYIIYKKNKKHILSFIAFCFVIFFILPESIKSRLKNILSMEKFKQDPSSQLRLIFWDGAVKAFKTKPLFGMNAEEKAEFLIENYKKMGFYDYVGKWYGYKTIRNINDSHNMYLQYLVNFGMGIFGLIYFMFIVIPSRLLKLNFYKKNVEKTEYIALEIAVKASFTTYLIQGITENNINNKSIILIFSVLLVIINFLVKENEKIAF